MNTNMKEMSLNELEAVNGGINWKRFLNDFNKNDLLLCVVLGPIGQTIVAAKAGAYLAAEIRLDSQN